MSKITKGCMALSILITLILFILVPTLGNLETMYQDPLITPEEFLENQPHQSTILFGKEAWFTQPSSTGLIFGLGILAVLIGIYFIVKANKQKSSILWGISLILWGIAGMLAGTSYQAFGYELKARGRDYVLFTSWFEIFYMLVQAYSTAFMVAAVGYSSSSNSKFREGLNVYVTVFAGVYTLIMLLGVTIHNTFLISYTGFIVFTGYNYLLMFIMNVVYYAKHHDKLNLYMMIIWLSFLIPNICYFIHLYATNSILDWKNTGIWFTENDTLHVFIIAWLIQIFFMLKGKIKDQEIVVKE